jgi:hypothetical protein
VRTDEQAPSMRASLPCTRVLRGSMPRDVIASSASPRASIEQPAWLLPPGRNSSRGAMPQNFAAFLMTFSDAFRHAKQLSFWAALASMTVRCNIINDIGAPRISSRRSRRRRTDEALNCESGDRSELMTRTSPNENQVRSRSAILAANTVETQPLWNRNGSAWARQSFGQCLF